MLLTIELDREFSFGAIEVQPVVEDRILAPELKAKASVAEELPDNSLGDRRILARASRSSNRGFRSVGLRPWHDKFVPPVGWLAPHPCPSPRHSSGRGVLNVDQRIRRCVRLAAAGEGFAGIAGEAREGLGELPRAEGVIAPLNPAGTVTAALPRQPKTLLTLAIGHFQGRPLSFS